MSESSATPRELGWEDEIRNDGGPGQILPEGDYDFVVKKFERARHGGSEKIPACNKAVLTLAVSSAGANGEVPVSLFLYSKFEWKLCQFFTAIGQRRHGEAIRMNWGAVPGAAGRCRVGVRRWTDRDGKERESNEVAEFYPPELPSAPGAGEQTWMNLPKAEPTPWDSGRF